MGVPGSRPASVSAGLRPTGGGGRRRGVDRTSRRLGVDYVVVGGFAGVLYGASGVTDDIDVVPRWDRDNLTRLCRALRAVEAHSIHGQQVTGESIAPEVLIENEITTWHTTIGRIDTLVGIPDSEGMPVDFTQLDARAVTTEVGHLRVAVADLDDIITSKEFASRAKDQRALPELRRIRDRLKP